MLRFGAEPCGFSYAEHGFAQQASYHGTAEAVRRLLRTRYGVPNSTPIDSRMKP